MGLLNGLLKRRKVDKREELRPLWHRVVEISREAQWYRDLGVEDSTAGRFDMITMVLICVLLRMEAEAGLESETTLLTELFVADMDGQLREAGIGDMVVGKHVGRLMSTLGGRWGALRDAFAADDDDELVEAIRRNVTLADDGLAEGLAGELRHLRSQLMSLKRENVLAGSIPR
ncbi:ubiquinol-cytochrome C chaperone family protein [Alteriqipengyuania sp. WL0013]|uniref:ubiquinol-cytochrome C chaperone family protein n=1 Tax=Alteriqipengyuania sp. WL0013 TaxID=3110773 RepID=UPI002C97A584|nr:ubiquinol-cytochrome C chaperone family protein [Alteriqipengyuania sp. WL0013]MEB3416783.1 ubiquinol-cytochrome C chaperone family protein [Alteriqipengyuania sp. WL0013]